MKGYFSIVQYCPDIGRREACNIGVALVVPSVRFAEVAMSYSDRRLLRFFGKRADKPGNLVAMRTSFVHSFRREVKMIDFCRKATNAAFVPAERRRNQTALYKETFNDQRGLEVLESFTQTLCNRIIMTEPRYVLVERPLETLADLVRDMVHEPLAPETNAHDTLVREQEVREQEVHRIAISEAILPHEEK